MTQNLDNEVGLLGAILRDPSKYEGLRELITPDVFDWHCHGWLWQSFEKLHQQGMSIDVITVGDELERINKLADFQINGGMFSGRTALGQIRSHGDPRAVETYASKVLDYSAKRQLLELMGTGAAWATNGRTAADIMADLSQRMAGIKTFDNKAARHTMTLAEAVSSAYDYTERAAQGKVKTVKTGFIDLDSILTGLYGGDVYYFASRPGQGKTALLGSLVKNVAEQGKRVAVFELEMTNQAIAMRLLAQQSGVSVDKQRSGQLLEDDWAKYTQAVEILAEHPVFLNDLPSITPSRIRQELRRIGNVDLVIVDYVQLASSDDKTEKRYLEVSSVARGLKSIAKEFDVPVVTAAQLSRAVEQRAEKKPVLSDLKESGGLEENADVVAFLYRPDQYEKDAAQNTAEIIVAKHRNGRVGKADLIYIPHLTRFESAAAKIHKFNE
jgi:replicative DNA helicase